MATLQTQYLLYLNENPESSLSFEEWMSQVWEPKLSKFKGVSDNFQIGPNGAYEHDDNYRWFEVEETLDSIAQKLFKAMPDYAGGDMSDIGNEVGFAIGKVITNITEEELADLIIGIKHGVSLTNGTH